MFRRRPYLTLLSAIIVFALSASMFSESARESTQHKPGCPTFDYSQMVVTKSTCNKSNGGVKGIVVTSTGSKISYVWHNEDGKIMARTVDLTDVPAGTYVLEVFDNSGCGSLNLSKPIEIGDMNGINIDETELVIKSSSCKNDGSITGIRTTNATSYTWYEIITNKIISTSNTTPDLSHLAPGSYRLALSNGICDTTKTYYIPSTFSLPQIISYQITDAYCTGGGGAISVSFTLRPETPRLLVSFQDIKGTHIYDGILSKDNLNPTITAPADVGDYSLYVQDTNGCVVLLGKYTVKGGTLEFSKPTIENDHCNQHLGSITPDIGGYKAAKGDAITWTDVKTGEIVGRGRTLTHIGAGTYQITIFTLGGCRGSATYTVIDDSPIIFPPAAAGSTICVPGMVNITITNPDTSKLFRLYDSPTSVTPIDSSKNGVFYRNVDQTVDFYVTRVVKRCESDRTKVTEVVVASFKRPNAFTPNGDGVNDLWNLEGVDKFPGADIRIYTRNGQEIYHSVNYARPFDGTHNGHGLPAGVYYYIIDLKQPICYGKISGNLTIIR